MRSHRSHAGQINPTGGGLYSKLITRTYEDGLNGTVDGRPSGFEIGTILAVVQSIPPVCLLSLQVPVQ
jgi:hypothetical protein